MSPELAAILLQMCKNTLQLVDQVEVIAKEKGRDLLRTPLENEMFNSAMEVKKFIQDNNL